MDARNPHGRLNMQCTAKSKQTGKRCGRAATAGRDVCHYHGGRTPSGPALPQFKHGRNIKYLPAGMQTKYQAALEDKELVSLRDDIAMVDVLEAELYESLCQDGTLGLFIQLKELFGKYRNFKAALKYAEAQSTLDQIETIAAVGADEALKRMEILTLKEQRRKLVESEAKRLHQAQQTITAEQALGMLAAVLDIIKTHVSDETERHRIGLALRTFVAGQSRSGADGVGVH